MKGIGWILINVINYLAWWGVYGAVKSCGADVNEERLPLIDLLRWSMVKREGNWEGQHCKFLLSSPSVLVHHYAFLGSLWSVCLDLKELS
jgi:hypothetical protein